VRISIKKKGRRHQLSCQRPDGTSVVSDLGPNLPHHDLAHFVVEHRFGLRQGFFGNIASGYAPEQLSDKEVIGRLGPESAAAEILARALQSLSSGACSPEQFEELVNSELAAWSIPAIRITPESLGTMRADFKKLTDQYAALKDGESMKLELTLDGPIHESRRQRGIP
jgi:hypothetical protein